MIKLFLLGSKHIFDIATYQTISLDGVILNSSRADYLAFGFYFPSFLPPGASPWLYHDNTAYAHDALHAMTCPTLKFLPAWLLFAPL